MPRFHWFSFRKSESRNHDTCGLSTMINCRIAWLSFAFVNDLQGFFNKGNQVILFQTSSFEMSRIHWFSSMKSKSHNHDFRVVNDAALSHVWPSFASWMIFRASDKAIKSLCSKARSFHLAEGLG